VSRVWRSSFVCAGTLAASLCGCGGASSHETARARTKHCVVTIVGVNVNGTGRLPPATLEKLGGKTVSGELVPCAAPPAVALAPGASPQAVDQAGRTLAARTGCLACHRIGVNGNAGPGENLTHIGSRLSRRQIETVLVDPTQPMPSFKNLPPAQLDAPVAFLTRLRR